MNRLLLRGRLSPPRAEGAVDRPRLITAAGRPLRRLTLLTAGAGMGKTWLAASLIRGRERSAWVSFQSADAEAMVAWSYIVEAFAPFLGDERGEIRALLAASFQPREASLLASRVSNALAEAPDATIVLDDAHALYGTDAWASIVDWIRSAPESLRFIVTAREAPVDYLGDVALHGGLTHIDHEGFLLTREEARAVIGTFEGLDLSEEATERLIREADGWIGALQMLVSAERAAPGSARSGAAQPASYLWQFLAREVVDGLDEEAREALILAAVLPTCNVSILQACFPEADMTAILDRLERRIPFLGRLSSGDETRRIHPLLSAFLRERFDAGPTRRSPALRRALRAYEEAGELAAAIEVALLLHEEGALVRLARLVATTSVGPHYLLRLPRDLAASDPELAMQRVFIHYARNEIEECRYFLAHYPSDAPAELAQTMQFLSAMLAPAGAEAGPLTLPRFTARTRFTRIPVADGTRLIMLLRRAMELHGQRRPVPALRALESIKAIPGWDATHLMKFYTLTSEAQIREECGELARCMSLYDEASESTEAAPDLAHLMAYVHLGRAGVLMKRFLLDECSDALESARPFLPKQPGTIDAGFVINEVELFLCRGDREEGQEKLRPLVSIPELHYGSAHYLLDLDRLGGADDAVRGGYRALCEEQGLERLTSEELMLYVRFGPTDPASDALLDDALARMRADVYVSRLLDALLLKAARARETDEALDALREAVHYAAPEGIVMPFVVERELPDPLLREAERDALRMWGPRERSFVSKAIGLRERLSGFPVAPIGEPPRGQALPGEALSDREREVLAHLARGESNSQIADALFIALPTVKTHVANILSKLGAARRTEAVAKARRQGLLSGAGP